MFFNIIFTIFFMSVSPTQKTIFDFSDPSSTQSWRIINDGVMGGLSSSTFKWQNGGIAVFGGKVSLENNGGFASVRSAPQDFYLNDKEGVLLRIKGDGKKYKFRIRTDSNFDGVAYSVDFSTTAGIRQELRLPFHVFQPTFRGRVLQNVKPLKSEGIRQFGFLIGDKQAGDFAIEINEIAVF